MIHVVFQRNDISVLAEAMKLDPLLQGTVVQIEDDYSVGPIKELWLSEGRERRKYWWHTVLAGGDYDQPANNGLFSNDYLAVESMVQKLTDDLREVIWVWAAQNNRDVSGYYWLVSQLNGYQGRVFILYLNNLPFISEKGSLFYPANLFEIPPREFAKAKKLARPITTGEFEIDSDEWARLGLEDKSVRVLEGGKKLVQNEADFYDGALKNFITANWQTAHKLILNFLHKSASTVGDGYLLWRLKQILAAGEHDVQGQLHRMKDFEIKLKSKQTETEAQPA
ncbi:MAG TPA: DUF1835 domain-containing protein [Puia sp.]|nr:DUF1835 domain-containing protein [Puia sp.]